MQRAYPNNQFNMIAKSGLMNKYPIFVFVLLTFFISHVLNPIIVELLRILFPSFSFNFPEAKLNERSLINQYGGTIAALFITVRLYGIHGLKAMLSLSRITVFTAPWLLISLLLPLILILLSYGWAGVSLEALLTTLHNNWPFYLLIIAGFVISAGLAEEFGWRGFLLPQLLKTCKPLTATFITFYIVSLWHFPALLSGWKGEPVVPWVILSFPIAVVHSWLFFKSRGNLWVVIVFHACFDAQYSFYSHFIQDNSVPNTPFNQGWTYIILYCLVAFLIIVFTKGSLGCENSTFDLNKYFGEEKNERPTPVKPPPSHQYV
jgi:membrane protease YdiL (CAAX protease family)